MNSEPQLLFQRNGWGIPVIVFSIVAALLIAGALLALWSINLLVALIDLSLAGIFATAAFLLSQREKRQGVLLTPRHLVIRDSSGETTEIHIENARVVLGTVTSGDVALLRTLDFGESEAIMPSKAVMVVKHGEESTELRCVTGLTPPKMRAVRDEINAALIHARREYNYPEPAWPS